MKKLMNASYGGLIMGIMLLTPVVPLWAAIENPAPLVFQYNLQGPGVVDSTVTSTAGTITAIVCSWESRGVVRVEVSANAGSSYTAIINGQPLTAGFLPGNQLCVRARLDPGSSLGKVTLGYKDNSGASRLYHNPAWKAFKYKKIIDLSGGSEELFNWPVKVRLGAGFFSEKGLKENFRGVRFAAADSETELDHYLEKINLRNGLPVSADFWIKLSQLAKDGGQICVYYGNTGAAAGVSSGEKVFDFFDDFSGIALDPARWEIKQGLEGSCTLKDGRLELKDCAIISRLFRIKKGIIEFRASAEDNSAIQAIARGITGGRAAFPQEQLVYSSAFAGAEHTIAVNDVAKLNSGNPIKPRTEYVYRVTLNNSEIIFERFSREEEKQAEIRFLNMDTKDEGYVGLKAGGSISDEGRVYFDWIRIRPYVEIEPQSRGGRDE